MLYAVLKVIVRLAGKIYFRKIIINKPALLKENGPLLLACSHPNSFLDAVVMDILFEKPIWSLTRGDAFLNDRITRLFYRLKMLPVYRPSEGVENLSENYRTFDTCIEIFKKQGLVLIFSEGLCLNEWHLRSLKKGTARLAFKSLQEKIPLKILPVGINYSSFKRFGKNLYINFGNIISVTEFDNQMSDGNFNQLFNTRLRDELRPLVFEIAKTDKKKQIEILKIKQSHLKQIILSIPALLGFIIHAPIYLPLKMWIGRKYRGTVHVDSMHIAMALLIYPFYLAIITFFLFYLLPFYWVIAILLFIPFSAWSLVQLKKQLDD